MVAIDHGLIAQCTHTLRALHAGRLRRWGRAGGGVRGR